jgi:1,4-dihydroxy-2-naphthoyl-CoA synthase
MTEGKEGRNAFLEKRKPNFEKNGCRNSVISVQF